MRAAPAVQVVIVRFGAWRIGVAVLALLSAASSVAGVIAQAGILSPTATVAGGCAAALSLLLGASLLRTGPTSLRWDGRQWHVGPAGSAGEEPRRGDLTVSIDLGAWMLLRFVPEAAGNAGADASPPRRAAIGIPVQRRGLEGRWHALRCAVYSPRSPSGDGSPADPEFPS